MAKVAFTRIKHGNPDGTIIDIPEGEEVKGLDKDTLEQLEAIGSIGDAPADTGKLEDALAAKEDEIAKLKEQLEAARGGKPGQFTATPAISGQASGPQSEDPKAPKSR